MRAAVVAVIADADEPEPLKLKALRFVRHAPSRATSRHLAPPRAPPRTISRPTSRHLAPPRAISRHLAPHLAPSRAVSLRIPPPPPAPRLPLHAQAADGSLPLLARGAPGM